MDEKRTEKGIEYTLARSGRKSIEVSVREGRVYVRCPQNMPTAEVEAFIEKKGAWINRHLRTQLENMPGQRVYAEGELFPLLGREYPIAFEGSDGMPAGGRFDGERILLGMENATPEEVRLALEGFYMMFAREFIPGRVARYLPVMGIEAGVVNLQDIRIKDFRTQWGSCTAKNRLAFNLRLVLYEERVVDYVVVHELAHVLRRDHSPAFWQLVEEVLPDYRRLRLRLKTHIGY